MLSWDRLNGGKIRVVFKGSIRNLMNGPSKRMLPLPKGLAFQKEAFRVGKQLGLIIIIDSHPATPPL